MHHARLKYGIALFFASPFSRVTPDIVAGSVCVCVKALIIAKGSWILYRSRREATQQFILPAQGAQAFSPSRRGSAGECPTPEKWASNKEALQSVLIWFWDAGTTYLRVFPFC